MPDHHAPPSSTAVPVGSPGQSANGGHAAAIHKAAKRARRERLAALLDRVLPWRSSDS